MKRRRLFVSLIGLGLFGFWAIPQFERARNNAVRSSCQSNLKRLGLAINQYIRDYDNMYPLPRRWRTVIQPYLFGFSGDKLYGSFKELDCPLENTGYAYNFFLNNKRYRLADGVAEKTAMIFDSSDLSAQNYQVKPNPITNRWGTGWKYSALIPQQPDYGGSYPKDFRHMEGNNVLFVDGHVALLNRKPNFVIK